MVDTEAPKKTVVRKTAIENKSWFNEEIKQHIKKRNKLYKVAIINKTEENWRNYIQQRNITVTASRKAKRNYYENEIDDNKYDTKKLWKTLKVLLKKSNNNNLPKDISFSGHIVSDDIAIANKFNDYFVNSVNEIINIIENVPLNLDTIVRTHIKFDKFSLINNDSISKIITKLPNKKGTDEGISSEIIKLIMQLPNNPLINIYNLSLTEGYVPSAWKHSEIIPIQKVVNTIKAEEFRPINMLPQYEKVLEKVVGKQLAGHLEVNGILVAEQYGFGEGHSCEKAVQSVISSWRGSIDDGYIVGAIFIDLRRAFETVDRNILLKKTESYGIDGVVLKWFQSYLHNRTQSVRYRSGVSDKIEVTAGVPQGSVLGPLLFLIYINDIININGMKLNIRLFADDMVIFACGRSSEEIEKELNSLLHLIEEYLAKNELKINVEKTKFMIIRHQRQNLGNSDAE